jgi:peptide/nickel transport system permease protein
MLIYILKRLLMFIPTLVVISLLAFVISIHAPGDPVEQLISGGEKNDIQAKNSDGGLYKAEMREKLGLNLPVFYVSMETIADIDTVFRIPDADQREMLVRISRNTGNPRGTMEWHQLMLNTEVLVQNFDPNTVKLSSPGYLSQVSRIKSLIKMMSRTTNEDLRLLRADSLESLFSTTSGMTEIRENWLKSENSLKLLRENSIWWKQWIPSLEIHGMNNQYHRWLFGDGKERNGIVCGDFGISYRDGQPISDRIGARMKWSMVLALGSLILAWLISVPLGLFGAMHAGGWFDKISSGLVFSFWSIPSFFTGTLLLVFFSNPDFLDWFPTGGVKDPSLFDPSWPVWKRLLHYLPYLVLPIATYTLTALAFLSRQVRAGVQVEMQKDYIRTARAKGVSEKKIVTRHAFRNSLIPLITILGQYLPAIFGGSVIIETIFSIPGMGFEIYESIISNDYPMIVTVFTLFGFMTMLGYLLSDIGYALADPRIRFTGKKS